MLTILFGGLLSQSAQASTSQQQQAVAEYPLANGYVLTVERVEYSSLNIGQELRLYREDGSGPIPEALGLIGAGSIDLKSTPGRDTTTHLAYILLLSNGGRDDPCHIYVPREVGTALLACR
jgi:hypothetical protein